MTVVKNVEIIKVIARSFRVYSIINVCTEVDTTHIVGILCGMFKRIIIIGLIMIFSWQ